MFLFYDAPPPPPSFLSLCPSSMDRTEAAVLWANDSRKIAAPQCVHSTLESLVLGRSARPPWDRLKGTGRQFGSKISFSGGLMCDFCEQGLWMTTCPFKKSCNTLRFYGFIFIYILFCWLNCQSTHDPMQSCNRSTTTLLQQTGWEPCLQAGYKANPRPV